MAWVRCCGGAPSMVNTVLAELYGYYQTGGGGTVNNPVEKATTTLTPVIDSTTKLRFFFDHAEGTYQANFDFRIKISTDGVNWIDIYALTGSGAAVPTISGDIDMSTYVGNRVYVKVWINNTSVGTAGGTMSECIIGHFS